MRLCTLRSCSWIRFCSQPSTSGKATDRDKGCLHGQGVLTGTRGACSDMGCLQWQGVPTGFTPSGRIPNERLHKSPELPVLHSAAGMHLVLHIGWQADLAITGNPLPSLTLPPLSHTLCRGAGRHAWTWKSSKLNWALTAKWWRQNIAHYKCVYIYLYWPGQLIQSTEEEEKRPLRIPQLQHFHPER